ncbi:MAG: hypothetical protein N2037_03315 [Acidimicrobiales bacterium]|nr:hypothetical protein [Acidimicrobiales bacterium]
MSTSRRRSAFAIAAGATLVYFIVGLSVAASSGGPVWFVQFGMEDHRVNQWAQGVLAPDKVVTPMLQPHDGVRFWILARDPLLLQADTETYLDHPIYRARRIAYPLAASPFRLFGEHALLWGLFTVNLGTVFVGTYLTAQLADVVGGRPGGGLAFACNPCVLVGVLLDLSDPLMIAALVGVLLALRRGRFALATLAAVVAVMTREVAFLGILGMAVGMVGQPIRRRLALVAVPTTAMAAWSVYLALRLDRASAPENFTLVPFGGWIEAYRTGWAPLGKWDEFLAALLIAAAGVAVLLRWAKTRSLEMWCSVGFCLLLPFVTTVVMLNPTNSSRILGPAVTLLAIDLMSNRKPRPWPRLGGLRLIRRGNAPEPAAT